MDRVGQFALSLPRAAMAPVIVGVALAVLAILGPTIFLRDREPFDRLIEFVEVVLGRSHPTRRPAGAALPTARLTAERRGGGRRQGSTGRSV
jgi:hypothetical protein